ncbi:hypothetical protein [Nocardia seriolae]|uniref:Uncharacterized protein n=1 Tax=Nocardia seriolae TaxID=37332 RepID=A0ABC8AZL5_9NOCA|nr:hypothetical protein [Nocardia seriolae]APA99779.1 hypothetical protein NS506_05736 [Nocardia seriolae]MTJ62631.1 hypothetical protein [Nocardia seriolae]MTJ75421.1 hypothetical protein [Nocardia seriolae]MTJ89329.1 hypothetical protein [Nocardia seriolae]MTK33306.1 hypothetical protein [Nocardia seriolae]
MVSTTYRGRHRARQRTRIDCGRSRQHKEFTQNVRIGVEAVGENRVAQPTQPGHARILGGDEIQRWFDQGQ